MSPRTPVALSIVVTLALFTGACGDKSAQSADTADGLYERGLVELYRVLSSAPLDGLPWEWDVDLSAAMRLFEAAVEHDPDHCGALLASAVTRMLSVLTDAELRIILADLFPEENRCLPGPLFWHLGAPDVRGATEHLVSDRPGFDFHALQEYIEDEAGPSLEVADQRLVRFEELACDIELTLVVPALPPDYVDVVRYDIDLTDALFVHSSLDALQATLHVLCAYELDTEEGQTAQELIEDDPDFLTLRPGGNMASAYSELGELAVHLWDAALELGEESDPQEDDVITLSDGLVSLDEYMGADALEKLAAVAEGLDNGLAEGIHVNPSTLCTDDPGAPDLDLVVDLRELFLDPLPDLRDYLPAHSWQTADVMCLARPISMPDPTLDGVTPGMTDSDWEALAAWLIGAPGPAARTGLCRL